mgnify:CR=1 FL=1
MKMCRGDVSLGRKSSMRMEGVLCLCLWLTQLACCTCCYEENGISIVRVD